METITVKTLAVKSPAFHDRGFIPATYTCEGSNISPPLTIGNIPEGTQSLALIVEDPDAPGGTFYHWVMWNIPPDGKIAEDSAPGREGKNSRQENKFHAPCPPNGLHHYHFDVFALDTELDLPDNTDKKGLMKAMEGHIIATGELVGLYKGD